MNKELNHIVSASLLLLLIPVSVFIIYKVNAIPADHSPVTNITPVIAPSLSTTALQGKKLFMVKCASCHKIGRNSEDQSLVNLEREPWANRKKLYDWIRDPATFALNDPYGRELKKWYNEIGMTPSPDLTNGDIDAIVEYINQKQLPVP